LSSREGRPAGRQDRGRRAGLAAKRLLDLAGAMAGLVVLSPVLAWIAVAILATQGRPVFFRQERPGLHARPFRIVKFRTMREPRPGEAWFRTDSDRVTRLGRLLRRTSLDELPELWNVIRGEMSLVGPRPLLMAYVDRYTERERLRHAMRPGITGWAAVNGRHTARFEDRLELDVWYVEHWSLALDVRIIGMTLRQLVGGSGVAETQDLEAIAMPSRFIEGLAASDHAGASVDTPARSGPNGSLEPDA
jgi:lipopolysaccharide/colanic/teichoic acid biosynthesis glycosyltransferase